MSSVTYTRLPHPLREGELLYYDATEVVEALEADRLGAPVTRAARGAAVAPEEGEVRGLEVRLRRAFAARSRVAWGRFLWWFLLGPALALLWVNFAPFVATLFFWLPPLAVFVATLGEVTGGPLLATVIGLVPLIWAWRRAARYFGASRRWGRLARAAGPKVLAPTGLTRTADPAVAEFAAASATLVERLREQAGRLADRGADAASEITRLAGDVYRLAQRHGLPGVASAYHAVYARFDAAEQRINRLDHAGGMLAERKVAAEAQRAGREAGAGLAAFAPTGRVRARRLAPLGGLLAGLTALGAALLLSGTYFVAPDQAVIVDPFTARLARLGALFGLGRSGEVGETTGVVRTVGFNWGWPRPFAERHAITLGDQQVALRAIFRQTGADAYDVLLVEMRFRISDVGRWSQLDRDGTGVDALSERLTSLLQSVVQQQRQEARQFLVQQNPALANDQAQLAARADQLVESRLEDIVRAFAGALSESSAASESGVQISREVRSRLVQGVPGAVAGVPAGQ
jgi:hypothetical protein